MERSTSIPFFQQCFIFLPQTQKYYLVHITPRKARATILPIEWKGKLSPLDRIPGLSAQRPGQGDRSGTSDSLEARVDCECATGVGSMCKGMGHLRRQWGIPLPGTKASCQRVGWYRSQNFLFLPAKGNNLFYGPKASVSNHKLGLSYHIWRSLA